MAAYLRPETVDQALAVLAQHPATIAAGCTDLFPATEAQVLPGPVLDLTAIPGLRGIEQGPDSWRIGATTTWTDLCRADLPPAFDMLKQAAREVGSIQIQNAGTVAGNLCNASPAADGVPPLLALDASVEVQSAGAMRQVPLAQFLTGVRQTDLSQGEMVTAIHIPASGTSGISRFVKLGARKYLVISAAMVAVRLVLSEGRITQAACAVGACSAVATRLPKLEQALIGRAGADAAATITSDIVAPALSPISDIRGDAAYRIDVACELLRRAVGDLAGDRAEASA